MARSRRFLAVLTLTAALAAACTNQDADRDDVIEALEDANADPEQAECVADGLDDELNQDQLNDVAGADDIADLDNDLEDTVTSVMDECFSGGGADDETTDDTEASDESTTTTAAATEGATTTTTEAP